MTQIYHSKNACCDIKLSPPKISKNSKKMYLDFFLRELKKVTHIYWYDGLYLVSIPKENISPREWIDKNIDKIYDRSWDGKNPISQRSLF